MDVDMLPLPNPEAKIMSASSTLHVAKTNKQTNKKHA